MFWKVSLGVRGMNMSMDAFMDLLRKHLSEKDFSRMMELTAGIEPERRTALMQFLAERETLAPEIGSNPPDIKRTRVGSSEPVPLSSFRGPKPPPLVLGIYT